MSDTSATAAAASKVAAPVNVSLADIFLEFLMIGATSFGGGVVAYLRSGLVQKKHWMDDVEFLELMSISNTLPGLNATNMSILVGDRLRKTPGAIAAMLGMCLPGLIFMTVAGIMYGHNGDRPLIVAMLKGVAAAAVGLIGATWFQIGKKSVKGFYDAFFILAAVLLVNQFKLSVPIVLLIVGALAIFAHRPARERPIHKEDDQWIRSLR
jgi:chromate transporter